MTQNIFKKINEENILNIKMMKNKYFLFNLIPNLFTSENFIKDSMNVEI